MRKYKKYYKLDTQYLPDGKVKHEIEYTGKYYICRLDKNVFTKKKVYHLTLALCSVIIMAAIGFLDTSSSRVFYVAVPYACLFLPVIYNLMGAANLFRLENKLEFSAYDKSINRIYRSSAGQLALGGITAVGDIIYLFSANADDYWGEYIFLGGMIIVLIFSALQLGIRKMNIYEVEE